MKNLFLYIKKDLKKHLFDYLLLITTGIIFLAFLKIFQGEKILSFVALLSFISLYIIWGIYHHAKNKTVYFKTVVEYILIGFTILFLLEMLKFIS